MSSSEESSGSEDSSESSEEEVQAKSPLEVPRLSYLCVQATSTPTERIFSKMNNEIRLLLLTPMKLFSCQAFSKCRINK